MAVNAFVSFFDKADGESIQKGKEKWIEIQGWDWGVEAETSWTKGGGASVGKPVPGRIDMMAVTARSRRSCDGRLRGPRY